MKQSLHLYLTLIFCFFILNVSHVYSAADLEKEINRLSKEIAKKISREGKKKVVVVDFTGLDGSVTELGRFIAEEFSLALAEASKRFIVVDRAHLKTILQEHNLASTGRIDQKTALRLGEIAGIKAIITGSLIPFGKKVRINVKVLDTKTAAIMNVNRGDIAMTDAVKSLMKKEVNGVERPEVTAKKKAKPSILRRIVEKGFVFDVLRCKRDGKKITCTLLVTNIEKDGRLSIRFANTSLYDNFGNEHPVQEIQIGNKVRKRVVFDIEKELFSGVTTTLFLTFNDTLPQAAVTTSLVLKCSYCLLGSYKWKKFTVKLLKIPLSD